MPLQTQTYRFVLRITPDSTPRLGWPWSMRETNSCSTRLALMLVTAAAVAASILIVIGLGGGGETATPTMATGQVAANFLVVGVLVAILMLYVNARMSLVLAAAAVGRSTGWRGIWQATSGNGWRVVWI